MRDFLYFLTDEAGRCYTTQNGLVTLTAVRTPLPEEPNGTRDILIGWERDLKRFGLVRNFSLKLDFVLEGAQILRHIFFNRTIEEKVFLVIQRHDVLTTETEYEHLYKYFYKGELDLSTVVDTGSRLSVSIIEGGLHKLLKAGEGTTQEIPFDSGAIKIKMDGVFLSETHNFIIPAANTTDNGDAVFHLIGAAPTVKEGEAAGFAEFSVFYEDLPSDGQNPPHVELNTNEDLRYLFTVSQDISGMVFNGTIRVRSFTNTNAGFSARLVTSTGRNIPLGGIQLNDRTEQKDLNLNYTFNAVKGEKFFLVGVLDGFFSGVEYYESNFSISFQSRYKTTYIKAHLPKVLGDKLTEKITGQPGLLSSSVLEASDVAISCGDAIRGISGAVIKTDFNKYLDFCRVVHFAGFAIERGRFVIEPLPYFLNFTSTVPLGETKDYPKFSWATDLMANTIKIGYAEKGIDNVNGKYEFNNSYLYNSPITKIVRELNLICPYYAQSYAIELLRINLEGKTTTDNGSDNDVFLIQIDRQNPVSFGVARLQSLPNLNGFLIHGTPEEIAAIETAVEAGDNITPSNTADNNRKYNVSGTARAGSALAIYTVEPVLPEAPTGPLTIATNTYNIRRDAFDVIEGLPAGNQSFNIGISPKRLLMLQMPYINSIMHGFGGQKLTVKTTERNRDLKTVRGAEVIDEDADEVIGNNILFIPRYAEFENIVPINLVDVKERTPNAGFDFLIDGNLFKGLDIKCGLAPQSEKEQVFRILLAPDSDLKTLE